MVLTTRVGRPRSFALGLFLTIVTFGIYGVYWSYKAHVEVHRQYELDREGRDDAVVWLVLGLLLPILLVVYYWKFVSNVRYVRARMQLPGGITPGGFVTGFVLASLVVFAGSIAALGALDELDGVDTENPSEAEKRVIEDVLSRVVAAYLGAIVVAVLVALVPFYLLQRDVNETWTWFDANVHQLTGGPGGGPPPYVPPTSYPTGAPPSYPPPSPPAPPPTWPPAWPPPQR